MENEDYSICHEALIKLKIAESNEKLAQEFSKCIKFNICPKCGGNLDRNVPESNFQHYYIFGYSNDILVEYECSKCDFKVQKYLQKIKDK